MVEYNFIKKNKDRLAKAAGRDNGGVDPFIVLSIIGIESNYGLNKGR